MSKSKPDPERLRLLEAVAEAARAILDAAYTEEYSNDYCQDGKRLWEMMAAGTKALKALDEKEQP